MVQFAKSVALNIDDQAAVSGWRRQNQSVSENLQTSVVPTCQIPKNLSAKILSVKTQSLALCIGMHVGQSFHCGKAALYLVG